MVSRRMLTVMAKAVITAISAWWRWWSGSGRSICSDAWPISAHFSCSGAESF